MHYLKTSIISGTVAAVLSIISGIFGQVSFGYVIIRAFLFFLVGGLIGLGLHYVIGRFIPELLEVQQTTVNKDSPSESEKQMGQKVDIVLSDDNPQVREKVLNKELDELQDELTDEGSDENQKVLSSAENDSIYAENKIGIPVIDDVDALPDIGKFAGSFQAVEEDSEEGSVAGSKASVSNEYGEPEVLARAVQTFLKKDQKG